jgi:hypothetical protein
VVLLKFSFWIFSFSRDAARLSSNIFFSLGFVKLIFQPQAGSVYSLELIDFPPGMS